MKVRDVMTPTPACCLATDTAQKVAEILRDQNVGSVPVVQDQESRRLTGIITDRDLCCSVIAQGLDPKNTPIERFITRNPVTCREDENLRGVRTRHARTPDQAHSNRGCRGSLHWNHLSS